jgi:hypothetical protein
LNLHAILTALLGSLSFTFPGTANGRFIFSSLRRKNNYVFQFLNSKFTYSLLPDTVIFFFAWRLPFAYNAKLKLSIDACLNVELLFLKMPKISIKQPYIITEVVILVK